MGFQYRCEECGNTIPALRIEKRDRGSKGMARLQAEVVCEATAKCGAMVREREVRQRREVSRHDARF